VTASQLRGVVARVRNKVGLHCPGMTLSLKRAGSDGYEVRVSSGKGKARRHGVRLFSAVVLPRIPTHGARTMLIDLVSMHVDYCLRGRS
jgi:hypothetical protein